MLNDLGCKNIADGGVLPSDALSMEAIIALQPDMIFFSTMGDEHKAKETIATMLESETWRTLTAVKEGCVHILPKDLFHYKPNARFADAYRYLATCLAKGGDT